MSVRKVALVTGASRGLGAATARRLCLDGFAVAINYRSSAERAENLAAEICNRGGEALAFRADVTDEDDVRALIEQVADAMGSVDVLINNATGSQPERPIEEYRWSDFQDQIDYFIKAPVLLVRETIVPMKRKRWGRIINIGSEVSEKCRADFSTYIAAKSAQLGLTRAWAAEFGPWNIAVNIVNPGWIPTERHADAVPASLDKYRDGVPMKRMGKPGDVAGAVSYLASEESGFVSGQRLSVNGANTF